MWAVARISPPFPRVLLALVPWLTRLPRVSLGVNPLLPSPAPFRPAVGLAEAPRQFVATEGLVQVMDCVPLGVELQRLGQELLVLGSQPLVLV